LRFLLHIVVVILPLSMRGDDELFHHPAGVGKRQKMALQSFGQPDEQVDHAIECLTGVIAGQQ